MAENLDLQLYRISAEAIMCALLPDSPMATSDRTDGKVGMSSVMFLQPKVLLFSFDILFIYFEIRAINQPAENL